MPRIIDFGVRDYLETLSFQTSIFENLVSAKRRGEKGEEAILIGEHYPVITLGRRAKENNVLLPDDLLERRGVRKYHVGRGGDVTYHCPGQIILYPIIDLEKHGLGVKDFVNVMEECIILLLKEYGIKGERVEGATGVWIGKNTPRERKICAMGIKCSHFCTMHGLALNVNSDLEGFQMINPCGFQDKGVTSIEKELELSGLMVPVSENSGKEIIVDVKRKLLHIFFSLEFPFEEILYLPEKL